MEKMESYPDRYTLTKEQSVFLAKRKRDENIYCGMKMENRAVTFPETQTILNGVNVPNVRLDDIQAILNMRDAWRHLVSTVDEPPTLSYICKLNEFVARNEAMEWGVLRTGNVGISGTDYAPPIPVREEAERELVELLASERSNTDKAISIFLWGVRRQLFWDGNKRTSLLAANKLLISGGNGMLTIAERNMAVFNGLLAAYHNTGEMDAIKQFLYETAIRGIDFPPHERIPQQAR